MSQTFCQQFNIQHPIIKAPMAGGCDTPDLMAAVANQNTLPFLGAAYMTGDAISQHCQQLHQLTDAPFGINLFVPEQVPELPSNVQPALDALTPLFAELELDPPSLSTSTGFDFAEQLDATLESGASVFSFTFGLMPKSVLDAARNRGMKIVGTATTVNEAKALAGLDVDAIVAQGSEAGGHRGTFPGQSARDNHSCLIGSYALIPQIVDAVDCPVIAAGGIMDGRGINAALSLGASAAALGTAFMSCPEAGIPNCYKQALMQAEIDQTAITRAFSGRNARGLRNHAMDLLDSQAGAILPFPYQNDLTRLMRAAAAKQGKADYLSLWAGQGVAMSRGISAAQLINALLAEMNEAP